MFKKILLLVLIFSLFLSSFGLVEASRGPRSNLYWLASPLGTEITEIYDGRTYFRAGVDTPTIIRYFYEWMIVLGGLAAFIAFIWAGLLYMTSVGDANKMTEAKKKIKNALLGLVLLLSSYLIFYTINPGLTKLGEPGIIGVDPVIATEVQERVTSFIKTYTQCLAVAKMYAQGKITVPIPLLAVTISIFPAEETSKIDYPLYNSFLGRDRIDHCGEFRSDIINRQEDSFPIPFNIGEKEIRNYGDLIKHFNFPPFP